MATQRSGLIATHSGLRGRPGSGLDRRTVEAAIGGLLELLAARGVEWTVGVARDARRSGEALSAQVVRLASEAGADVVDFGVVSTPGAKLAGRRRELGAVVIVTGSHLGAEWNGLKLVAGPDYRPLDVRTLPPVASGRLPRPPGSVTLDRSAVNEHAAAVSEALGTDTLRRARLAVRVSGGCDHSPRLALRQLGCRLDSRTVDLGLRLDADGDRLQLVDETGQTLDPELTLALTALSVRPRTVVKSADTSRMVDEMGNQYGWSVQVTPPGELHLVTALAESDGQLAGEGNGGVVIPAVGLARDGLAAAVSVLELVARERVSLSRLGEALPRLERRRTTCPCGGVEQAREALAGLAERLGAGLEDPLEGVRIERDGAWALVRQSATEPVIRVTVEAPDGGLADELHAEVAAALPPGA
jgi:phosphomannomutase